MKPKQFKPGENSTIKKNKNLRHFSKEENELIDLIVDIIAGSIIQKANEEKIKSDAPKSEFNP